MARSMELNLAALSSNVVTLWYRAPEVLLGYQSYGYPIDVWSCGCIMGELAAGRVLFPGENEISQLQLIMDYLGPFTDSAYPGISSSPSFSLLPKPRTPARQLNRTTLGQTLGRDGVDLFQKCMQYNPETRITAAQALQHDFFADMMVSMRSLKFPLYRCSSPNLQGSQSAAACTSSSTSQSHPVPVSSTKMPDPPTTSVASHAIPRSVHLLSSTTSGFQTTTVSSIQGMTQPVSVLSTKIAVPPTTSVASHAIPQSVHLSGSAMSGPPTTTASGILGLTQTVAS